MPDETKPVKATPPKATAPPVEHKQPVDEPQPGKYHDALSGRPVDSHGAFIDGQGDGIVPAHRIVADDWTDHERHTK